MRSNANRSGFTLVEIVLALGLISFALVGVFGLLSAATTSSANSDRDTTFVSMTSQVMNEFRGIPFNAVWMENPRDSSSWGDISKQKTSAPADSRFYFTAEGTLLKDDSSSTTTAPLGAVYLCTVRKTVDGSTKGFEGMPANVNGADSTPKADDNVLDLQLTYKWPAAASKTANFQIVYAKLARY